MALRVLRAADVDRRVAAGLDDAVERAAIDDQVLDDGNAFARHGSRIDAVAVLEAPHVQLAHGRAGIRPVRDAVDQEAARAADPLAAVRIERDRIFPSGDQPFVDDVEHLEEGHVGRDVLRDVILELARAVVLAWRQTLRGCAY